MNARSTINVNLMARGEPLANPHFLSGWRALAGAFEERAVRRGMGLQLNVLTIMPSCLDPAFVAEDLGGGAGAPLLLALRDGSVLPAALATARDGPRRGADVAGGVAGAYGGRGDVPLGADRGRERFRGRGSTVLEAVRAAGLRASFNQVRLNPPASTGAVEPGQEVRDARFRALVEELAGLSGRQVPLAGFDARASCGMLVEGPWPRRRTA